MKNATKKTAAPKKVVKEFRTVNDLLLEIEGEIEGVKSGELNESKARVVAKNRQLQLQGFQLILQAARIETRFRGELGKRIGITASLLDQPPINQQPQ